MTDRTWDGHDLLSAVRHAAGLLGAHAEEVNALNVFPVPDGDTGSNMLATVQAAVEEADELAVGERSVPAVGAALSLGALMGARGNSGVILSQIFRGMSEVVTGLDRVSGPDLARAFERGCQAAFAAVAHPVEGTILTVARDVAAAAEPIARKRREPGRRPRRGGRRGGRGRQTDARAAAHPRSRRRRRRRRQGSRVVCCVVRWHSRAART